MEIVDGGEVIQDVCEETASKQDSAESSVMHKKRHKVENAAKGSKRKTYEWGSRSMHT